MTARIYMHLPGTLLKKHGPDGFGLYARARPQFEDMGFDVRIVERPSTTKLSVRKPKAFHLVHHGFLRRRNVLNCGVSYVWPYWYVDPRGVLCDSSAANANPDFSKINPDRATAFMDALQKRFVEQGRSKHVQPARGTAIGKDRIVVFLQGMSDPVLRNMYMMETEMLDLVALHRGRREVLIKVHPQFPDTVASQHAERLAETHDGIHIVSANIHDMLGGAYCSVSINSGACFEGLLHRTPAILFGHSDFRACAVTVTNAAEAEEAFRTIRDRVFQYELFLYWFLRRKMFDVQNPNLIPRILRRIARNGFEFDPIDRRGLKLLQEAAGKAPPRGAPVTVEKAGPDKRRGRDA